MSGITPGPSQWEADDWPSGFCHGLDLKTKINLTSLLTWQRTRWASSRKTYQSAMCRKIIAVYWDNHREHINVLCVLCFKTGSRNNKGNNYRACIRFHPAWREVRKLIFYLLVTTYKIGVEKTHQWLISRCITYTSHTTHSFAEQWPNMPSV